MVRELDRYGMIVPCRRPSGYIGSNVYQIDGSVVVAAGPTDSRAWGAPAERRGCRSGTQLTSCGAWQEAGNWWKAWSLRLISTQLQIGKE